MLAQGLRATRVELFTEKTTSRCWHHLSKNRLNSAQEKKVRSNNSCSSFCTAGLGEGSVSSILGPFTTSQPHRLIHGEDRLRAASQHAVRDSAPPLLTLSHFQTASRSRDYNSQKPLGDSCGALYSQAPPSSVSLSHPAKVCARNLCGANLGLSSLRLRAS